MSYKKWGIRGGRGNEWITHEVPMSFATEAEAQEIADTFDHKDKWFFWAEMFDEYKTSINGTTELFPNGFGISIRKMVIEFFNLPHHVRCQVMKSIGAPVDDPKLTTAYDYVKEHSLQNEFISAVQSAVMKRGYNCC